MPINKETIISVFDEKLTLMQWLKTINKALEDAVLTGVEVRQKGNATFSFVVTFEDGTELESNEFVLAQGESINGATIRNGHLYLSLTNGDELDAGNLKPVTSFTINGSQHLIVNYGDGTSQDLGPIFQGNVTIHGDLEVTGDAIIPNVDAGYVYSEGAISGGEIVERMSGYSFGTQTTDKGVLEYVYCGVVKNGNKVTFVNSFMFTKNEGATGGISIARVFMPQEVIAKIIPAFGGATGTIFSQKILAVSNDNSTPIEIISKIVKYDVNSIYCSLREISPLIAGTRYYIRQEATFLLSANLAV